MRQPKVYTIHRVLFVTATQLYFSVMLLDNTFRSFVFFSTEGRLSRNLKLQQKKIPYDLRFLRFLM